MDCLSIDRIFGYLRRIRTENEGSKLVLGTEAGSNIVGIANGLEIIALAHSISINHSISSLAYRICSFSVSPNQWFICPFEDDQAHKRVTRSIRPLFHEFGENERLN